MTRWLGLGWTVVLGVLLCGSCLPAAAGQRSLLPPAKGRLLVATEQIRDPRFRQSVILLLKHDPAGVSGVILNQPLDYRLGDLLPLQQTHGLAEEPVYAGGPLYGSVLLTLVATAVPPPEGEAITGGYHLVRLDAVAAMKRRDPTLPLRIFVGHAGWSVTQLRREIERGDWLVLPADERLLDRPAATLWQELNHRREELWI